MSPDIRFILLRSWALTLMASSLLFHYLCNIFNNYFVNVAKDIGNDSLQFKDDFSDHPSIQKILENNPVKDPLDKFSFKPVEEMQVHKIISKLDIKKSTGVDNISAKILKTCVSAVSGVISNLINTTYSLCKFPTGLKGAQVLPLHKKNDPLDKAKFRPVSLLPIISKIYERNMHDQLSAYLGSSFNPFLAAFRKGFGCQSTLLRLLEDWRKALDNNECVAAIFMDLSKAFDCLPHELLVAKLRAYGLSEEAVKLLDSYLSDRSQQIRLGPHTSTWERIFKGIPQGSILGPLLFNVFINDIFYFVVYSIIHNYADDNTLSYTHKDFNFLRNVLQEDSLILIQWFDRNFMEANPDKFQAICVGKQMHDNIDSFQIGNTNIKCEDNVTLLGVNIDFMLKFDDHVSDICKKASKQLAVLKRLGRFLIKQGKLVIYNSFIASNFSYCPLAWHFCSSSSTNKLEKIQERALRFIFDDHSSSLHELLLKSNTQPLHVRRLKQMACEVYKIFHQMCPEYIQNLVNLRVSSYNLRGDKIADIPRVNSTRFGLRSFRYEAARVWNSLPNELRVVESYPQFRRMLHRWDCQVCQCSLCSG